MNNKFYFILFQERGRHVRAIKGQYKLNHNQELLNFTHKFFLSGLSHVTNLPTYIPIRIKIFKALILAIRPNKSRNFYFFPSQVPQFKKKNYYFYPYALRAWN